MRKHPEEQNDEGKANHSAILGEGGRRLTASDYLVQRKQDGAAVKWVNGQDVQQRKNERQEGY